MIVLLFVLHKDKKKTKKKVALLRIGLDSLEQFTKS
jgi:hypothetical protein